ncbi:MAG: hypothetical protein P4L76_17700 [Beijerinckiaceae bacterium]|nr:hypothetical protein [Beijerinckiaceae bacterium]
MGIAAAAAIGGVATLGGALISSNAAKSASQQQYNGTQASIAEQDKMFNTAQSALSPYYTAGDQSNSTLQALLNPSTAMPMLENLPGFKFQSGWGTMATTNSLTAEGLGGSSGPLAKAISDYNSGLASTYYTNYANTLQQSVNSGLGAASALAGNATNTGQSIGQTQQAGANALASGTLGSANALGGGLTSAGGSLSTALMLNSLNNSGGGMTGTLSGLNSSSWFS